MPCTLQSITLHHYGQDLTPTFLEKAFTLAQKLRAKPTYQPKYGVLAHLLVSKTTQAKPPKTPAINVMYRACQGPNWPTSTGFLPVFAALAAIPEVSSCNTATSILTLQNKDLFLFSFYCNFLHQILPS
ncbi:hypothetical protein DSO57_1021744 [Entomophthora muscae]|uniref:Uncharacterized protein n=1 Tax=Entomophthora muscae TaxID=34485 RepID=A0ACC2RI47_9FUNG|nr:hypothetical protein DSO57_1021744 [Entomophthora muscae]